MDQNGKRERSPDISADGDDRGGEDKRKHPRPQPPDYDVVSPVDEDDDLAALLNVGEEAFAELRDLLEGDKASPAPAEFQPLAAYLAINGTEESCGPLFSGGESSVMASVDISGIGIRFLYTGPSGSGTDEACEGKESGSKDCSDGFDGMLATFLGEDICDKY